MISGKNFFQTPAVAGKPGAFLFVFSALLFVFIAPLLIPSQSFADPVEDGMSAFKRKDYPAAIKLWQPLADAGNVDAQWNIGVMYEDGEGVKQDYVQAYMWFTLAAQTASEDQSLASEDRDFVASKMTQKQIAAAEQLVVGWKPTAAAVPAADQKAAEAPEDTGPLGAAKAALTRQDYPAALKLLQPLADKGDAEAQYILGTLEENGEGVTPDDAAAAKWYALSAAQGAAAAEIALGDLCSAGRGVPQDPATAAKWYRKAAEQGDAEAEFDLGEMYSSGKGVAADEAEAAKWYRKAAEQGDAIAQDFVADECEYGRGEAQDLVQAFMWFTLANAGAEDPDYKVAAEGLGRLAAEMTPEQINEAKRLAAAWKPAEPTLDDSGPGDSTPGAPMPVSP